MDTVDYELFLGKFNDFILGLPDDNDVLLLDALDLKNLFIDLFGDD